MKFLDPAEKVKNLRLQLGMKQSELERPGVSRNYISMIEDGKRPLTERVAQILAESFNCAAIEKGISLFIEPKQLMQSPCEGAHDYCMNKLADVGEIIEIDEILTYGITFGITEVIIKCYIKRADFYSIEGNYLKALSDYNEALQLAYREKEDESLVTIWNKIGGCYIRLMDYNSAIIYLTKACHALCLKDESEQSKEVIHNLALCYCGLGEYERAIENIDKYINQEYGIDTDKVYCGILLTKGGALIECGRIQEAEELFVKLMNSLDEDNKNKGYCLHNLGSIYNRLGKYKEAEKFYSEAIILRKACNLAKASSTIIELGDMYTCIGRENDALNMLYEGIKYAKDNGVYKDIIKGYQILEDVYRERKDFDMLENTYINLMKALDGNQKLIEYRNMALSKMGLLYLEKNSLDEATKTAGNFLVK